MVFDKYFEVGDLMFVDLAELYNMNSSEYTASHGLILHDKEMHTYYLMECCEVVCFNGEVCEIIEHKDGLIKFRNLDSRYMGRKPEFILTEYEALACCSIVC